jgi:hypothetical protein
MLALANAWADTIHLKNGRTIVADHVRENGNHYEYDIGDDSYAIPKSSVDHVDAGGMPTHSTAGSAKMADLPTFTPSDSLANEGDIFSKIIKEGKVDPDVLASLEAKGNAELSATAGFIAGKFEFEHGNIAQARGYFDSALRFQPDNSTILIYYAALLVRTGNAAQAICVGPHKGRRCLVEALFGVATRRNCTATSCQGAARGECGVRIQPAREQSLRAALRG